MAGFGLAQDAIVRTRQNKSLRTSQKHEYHGGKQNTTNSKTCTLLKSPDISAEELEALKHKIRKQARKEKIRLLILTPTILASIILLLGYLLL